MAARGNEIQVDPKWKKALLEADIPAAEARWQGWPESSRPDAEGLTLILWSIARKLPPESAAWLCAHGADPLHATLDAYRGSSDAVTIAIAGGNCELLTWFFNNKITQPITPARLLVGGDRTPLVEALFEGREDVAEFLLNSGADIDQATPLGNTALHIAAAAYKVAACNFLVKHGADPLVKNFAGLTPCELVPETQSAPWNPDCIFEMLDGYRQFVEDGGKPGSYDVPEDARDEAAIERVGETYKAKSTTDWTEDDHRAAKALAARAADGVPAAAGEAARPLRKGF